MATPIIDRLEGLLCQFQLGVSDLALTGPSSAQKDLFNRICSVVFDKNGYVELWDEPVLSQLKWLFTVNPLKPTVFGEKLTELRQRTQQVHQVNNLFSKILSREASAEKIFESLEQLQHVEPSVLNHLKSSNCLRVIREENDHPSAIISALLSHLAEKAKFDLTNEESVKQCLAALKERERPGVTWSLLIRTNGKSALGLPLIIKLQPGNGQVHKLIDSQADFQVAIERARLALVDHGFLKTSDDARYSSILTDPHYHGPSIGLAAAVGMYGAAKKISIDPYTAFTGDINQGKDNWVVQSVSGLPQKLDAARRCGCRRVFIPKDNLGDVTPPDYSDLKIVPVDNLREVFLQLQTSLQPLPENSLQDRKINALHLYCQEQGWALSAPQPIQNGFQFRIAPLHIPLLILNIYSTGAHSPKEHDSTEYQELLKVLEQREQREIPIQRVQQTFTLQDPVLRRDIQEALEKISPEEKRQESHCAYSFRFKNGKENLTVKQYQTGKLQIQGSAGELYKMVLEGIVPLYNLHNPNARHSVQGFLRTDNPREVSTTPPVAAVSRNVPYVPLPYIGTDESGKGDYFGPLVVSGVLIDSSTQPQLETMGVKDSKSLSDKRCRELADQIRNICQGKYYEVEISPERYNDLYEDFRRERKNLNHLLAWGHARVIEDLLKRASCTHAVADQFGDERYINSKLMEKGKTLNLVQIPKGERYLAVAAASILSRDHFLASLEKLSQTYQMALPKGASASVITAGKQVVEKRGRTELKKVAKLHHKTTQKILDKE